MRLRRKSGGSGGGRGAIRGECGASIESFCLRGRSAYVGFSCLFLLAPVRGGTSFLCKRAKKRSKETRFKPPIFKCRRCSFQAFGTNVVPPQILNPQSNTLPKLSRHAHASPQRPPSSLLSMSQPPKPPRISSPPSAFIRQRYVSIGQISVGQRSQSIMMHPKVSTKSINVVYETYRDTSI
jgi:hypothetical protein